MMLRREEARRIGGGRTRLASALLVLVALAATLGAVAPPATSAAAAYDPPRYGDLYVVDGTANRVLRYRAQAEPAGSDYYEDGTVGTGLVDPTSVAVSRSGHVYIADRLGPSVIDVAPDGTQRVVTAPLPWVEPVAVAVDGADNLYVVDRGAHRVWKIGPTGLPRLIADGASNPGDPIRSPLDVAVDLGGNVFIAAKNRDNALQDVVLKVTPSGAKSIVYTTSTFLQNVAVNRAGDVWLITYFQDRIVKLPAGGGAPVTIVDASSSAPSFNGLGLDGRGQPLVGVTGASDPIQFVPSGRTFTYPLSTGLDVLGVQEAVDITADVWLPAFPDPPAAGGVVGVPYLDTGVVPPVTYAMATDLVAIDVVSGAVPDGLALGRPQPADPSCPASCLALWGTPTKAGTFTFVVEASNALDLVPATITVTIAKGTPTLEVTAPATATMGSAAAVSATSPSTGAISWSTTGPCSYADGSVSFSAVGDCVITADQAATADYKAASASATIVATDPPVLPTPRVLPGTAQVDEGNTGTTALVLPVTLSNPSDQTVTVDWTTHFVPGLSWPQADPASDYSAASGTVTFAPGETTRSVTIEVSGDLASEPNELLVVSFRNPTNATMGGFWGLGFAAIVNDDAAIIPGAASMTEGDSGATVVEVPVTLSSPSTATVTVEWSTAFVPGAPAGQAAEGTDYLAASGLVTFAPGETSKTVAVEIVGDLDVEADEYIVVSFHNPTNAFIGGFWGLGFAGIINDD